MKTPLEIVRSIDDKLCIAAAYIKEKIPTDRMGETLRVISAAGTALHGIALGQMYFDGNPLYKVPLSIKLVDGCLDMGASWAHESFKDYRNSGAKHPAEIMYDKFTPISRMANFYGGIGLMAKPIVEYLATGSAENLSVDITFGSSMLLTSTSGYLKSSDDEGLKKHREEKEMKQLESEVNLAYEKI